MKNTRRQLTKRISMNTGYNQADIAKVLKSLAKIIVETLKAGERIELRGFGTFKVVLRKQRIGHNPHLNSPPDIIIPACKVIKFRASKGLLDDTKTQD